MGHKEQKCMYSNKTLKFQFVSAPVFLCISTNVFTQYTAYLIMICQIAVYRVNPQEYQPRPCGPTDKASDYESGDSRFESWQGRFFSLFITLTNNSIHISLVTCAHFYVPNFQFPLHVYPYLHSSALYT